MILKSLKQILNFCSYQKTFTRGGVSPEFCKQNSSQATRKTLFSKSLALWKNTNILAEVKL